MGKEVVIHLPDATVKSIPIDDDGQMYLNFDTRFDEFDAVSFSNMSPSREKDEESHIKRLVGKYRRHVKGRIAIVGHTSTGIDVGSTPLYANINMVFVQMTAMSNILSGNHVLLMTGWRLWILWAVIALLFTMICHFEKTARLGPTAALVIAFYLTLAYLGIHYDVGILPVVGPLFYFGMCSFSVLSFRFFTEEREKRKIRGMFSTMVSDKVLSYLEESPESFSLTGHNVEATVFFSDVARFTSISENMEPERLTEFLNRYLTPVTDSIIETGGYVDKYVGDAVMAVWGAPYRDPEHAVNACKSALDQQEIIREMNEELRHEYGCEIHVRMGLNSGTVTAGNMGSERKFQYTVMGDVVNLASRLEPANKDFGTSIIIGESTNRLAIKSIESRMLDKIVVVGKEEIVPVYELLGIKGQVDESLLAAARAYEQALSQFYERNWDECLELLKDVTSIDTSAAHLESRAIFCKKNPPPETWQGEYVRAEKK